MEKKDVEMVEMADRILTPDEILEKLPDPLGLFKKTNGREKTRFHPTFKKMSYGVWEGKYDSLTNPGSLVTDPHFLVRVKTDETLYGPYGLNRVPRSADYLDYAITRVYGKGYGEVPDILSDNPQIAVYIDYIEDGDPKRVVNHHSKGEGWIEVYYDDNIKPEEDYRSD